MDDKIMKEAKNLIDRKIKPRIENEWLAFRDAERAESDMCRRILDLSKRTALLQDELNNIEVKIEKALSVGNQCASLIAQANLKRQEIEAVEDQVQKLKQTAKENRDADAAASVLNDAFKREAAKLRDEYEDELQAQIDGVIFRIAAWKEGLKTLLGEYNLQWNQKFHHRLSLFYGLNYDGLEMHMTNHRDAFFFQAKQGARRARRL